MVTPTHQVVLAGNKVNFRRTLILASVLIRLLVVIPLNPAKTVNVDKVSKSSGEDL